MQFQNNASCQQLLDVWLCASRLDSYYYRHNIGASL